MGTSKKVNHYQNQRGFQQPMSKPSPSTVQKPGVTAPIQKPSPSTVKKPGVTGPKC